MTTLLSEMPVEMHRVIGEMESSNCPHPHPGVLQNGRLCIFQNQQEARSFAERPKSRTMVIEDLLYAPDQYLHQKPHV